MSIASVAYPDALSLAQTPTPLQALDRLSAELNGPRIWVKRDDLTGSVLSGNKVRKLEFVLAEALRQGCDTLITCGGMQSNHCRATAVLAAQVGLKAHLLLRGEPDGSPDGNLLLGHLCDATISHYPPKVYRKTLEQLFEQWSEHYRAQGRKAFSIPTGASDGLGLWGYIKCCEELKGDFKQHQINPELIVCASGSGGTQAGLTAGCILHEMDSRVLGVAVCDDKHYFKQKVLEDVQDWKNRYGISLALDEGKIETDDQHVGPGYGLPSEEHLQTIKHLAKLEGLILDPVYTGKAFAALIDKIKSGELAGVSDVVFVHTGGIFGVFPQRDAFGF